MNEILASGEDHVEIPASCAGGSAAAIVSDGCQQPLDDDGREPAGRSESADERIALHEIGGHALVARLVGNELGGVTCDPGPDFGGLTWGPAHDRSAKFSSSDTASIAAIIGSTMPRAGEDRSEFADVYMSVHGRVVELVAGSVAEALFLPGEPWPAHSDRKQERALASLICSSSEATDAFIDFCMVEAAALLRPREKIVRALTMELLLRRSMTGAEVDQAINAAVAAMSIDDERARRADWASVMVSAAAFAVQLA